MKLRIRSLFVPHLSKKIAPLRGLSLALAVFICGGVQPNASAQPMSQLKEAATSGTVVSEQELSFKASKAITQIRIVTDGFAPLQYLNDGKPDGYVTEYILATIERVKKIYPFEVGSFEFLPWKRALLVAKNDPNTLFFSLSRTAEREPHYLWLETVSPYRQSFFRLKENSHISVDSLEALRDSDYFVGIQRGGSAHSLVEKLAFKLERDYTTYTHYSQGIQMLYNDRIDMLPLTEFLARNAACRGGFDGDLLVPVIAIEVLAKPLWATFSHNSDPKLVAAFKTAMAELKEEGTYQEILDRHLTAWSNQPCKTDKP